MSQLIRRLSTSIGAYFRNVADDYWTVVKETAVTSRKRKIRTGIILSAVGGVLYAGATAPTEEDFLNVMRENRLNLISVSDQVRNPVSESDLERKTILMNEGKAQYVNCIFWSLILRTKYNPQCDLYAAHCKELQPKFTDLPDRIIDVGAFGRWFYAEKAMEDYDVNQSDLDARQFAVNLTQ